MVLLRHKGSRMQRLQLTGQMVVPVAAGMLLPIKQQQQQQQQHQQPPAPIIGPALYLVGAWSTIKVDPSVWGFGPEMGILQYTVREANCRLLQTQCAAKDGWQPGVGMRPRLWRDRQGQLAVPSGLNNLEAGQKRTFQDMMSAPQASSAAQPAATQSHNYHEEWTATPPPRLLPLQRAAARLAVVTDQRQQQHQQTATRPAVEDLADPLTGSVQPVDSAMHPWVEAYKRLHSERLPRELRVFGWRLLHNGVRVGAVRMYGCQPGSPSWWGCACQHEQCQLSHPPAPLATLSHVLVECPVASAAWAWLKTLWSRIDTHAPLPLTSRVLLLDDRTDWAPARDVAALWQHLRLLLLESLFLAQSAPAAQPNAAKAVVSRFIAVLRRQVQADWQRVQADIRWRAGVPFTWFRGRDPNMDPDDFAKRWCVNGVIATTAGGLAFNLTLQGL